MKGLKPCWECGRDRKEPLYGTRYDRKVVLCRRCRTRPYTHNGTVRRAARRAEEVIMCHRWMFYNDEDPEWLARRVKRSIKEVIH